MAPNSTPTIVQKAYFPDLIAQKLSHQILQNLKKNSDLEKDVCVCDWQIKQRDLGSDTVLIKTNYIECIPREADAKYFCGDANTPDIGTGFKSEGGYKTYSAFSNCTGPLKIRTQSCFFQPGVTYRAVDGKKVERSVTINPEILKYSASYKAWSETR